MNLTSSGLPRKVALVLALSAPLFLLSAGHAQQTPEEQILQGQTGSGSMGNAASGSAVKPFEYTRNGPLSIRQADAPVQHKLGSTLDDGRPLEFGVVNDFQKFVQDATGRALTQYGSDFFRKPGGYSASQNVPISGDYRIGPGDEVLIRGWGSIDVDVRTVVDRNGLIFVPRVGSIQLAGVPVSQLEPTIKQAISRYFKDFQLAVSQGQLRGLTVYVVGLAKQPGAYSLPGASTLISALFATGGPNALGSMRHVQVKREGKTVAEVDLYDFIARGDKSSDIRLQDGDTIVIPPAKGFVALAGKVSIPAIYELFGEQDPIKDLLSVAAGVPISADPKKAYLERVNPSEQLARTVESFDLTEASIKRSLKNGDILTVQPLTPEFANAVTLRGNVAQPARMPWRDGMRVSDLIPDKASLMSRDSIARQNGVLINKPRDTEASLASTIGTLIDEVNLEYAVVERVDKSQINVQLLPFNLGRVLESPGSQDDIVLQPGDVVTVFSVNDVRVPKAKRQVFVQIEGEVMRPGVYQLKSGDGLQKLIDSAGGLTSNAYLFGAGFYREDVRKAQMENLDQMIRRLELQLQAKTTVVAANGLGDAERTSAVQARIAAETSAQKQVIERLRNLKPSGRIILGQSPDDSLSALPSLSLEPRDKLVIPSRPDFVIVLGSVNTEASMLFKEGATIQDYLDQSGMTGGADLDELFVLRLNGSVLSDSGRWVSSVRRMKALPGDLIVLPEKADHESTWAAFTRNAKDITQIVYQFSLGAAAIKTLRN